MHCRCKGIYVLLISPNICHVQEKRLIKCYDMLGMPHAEGSAVPQFSPSLFLRGFQ
jgi:hypothetical protein